MKRNPEQSRRRGQILGSLTAVVSLSAAALFMSIGAGQASASATCTEERVPVQVPATAELAGSLCSPDGAQTVQLLVPGGSYNRSYWMFPERSYADAANSAGFATFAVDRLNTGRSSKLDPTTTNLTTNAEALHQSIDWLKQDRGFDKVVLVGHSLGTGTILKHTDLYPQDADAVILSGFSHAANIDIVASALSAATVPAPLSGIPALQARAMGDLVLPDSVRNKIFHTADTPPSVVATDNATKDSLTVGESIGIATLVAGLETAVRRVSAPILLAIGSQDAVFTCGPGSTCDNTDAWLDAERRHYPDATSVDGYILPGSGHCINLANNAEQWFTEAQEWVSEKVAA